MVDERNDPAPPRMPRWVKTLLISVLILIVVGVLVMLVSGGEHGPGRHGALGSESPVASVAISASRSM